MYAHLIHRQGKKEEKKKPQPRQRETFGRSALYSLLGFAPKFNSSSSNTAMNSSNSSRGDTSSHRQWAPYEHLVQHEGFPSPGGNLQ